MTQSGQRSKKPPNDFCPDSLNPQERVMVLYGERASESEGYYIFNESIVEGGVNVHFGSK